MTADIDFIADISLAISYSSSSIRHCVMLLALKVLFTSATYTSLLMLETSLGKCGIISVVSNTHIGN